MWTQHGSAFTGRGRGDLVGCIPPAGKFFSIETKTLKGKARKKQEQKLRDVRAAGGLAFVARTVEEIVQGVTLWQKGIAPYMNNDLDFSFLPLAEGAEAQPGYIYETVIPTVVEEPKPKRTRGRPKKDEEPNGTAPNPVAGTPNVGAVDGDVYASMAQAIFDLGQEMQVIKSMVRQTAVDMDSANELLRIIVQLLEAQAGQDR